MTNLRHHVIDWPSKTSDARGKPGVLFGGLDYLVSHYPVVLSDSDAAQDRGASDLYHAIFSQPAAGQLHTVFTTIVRLGWGEDLGIRLGELLSDAALELCGHPRKVGKIAELYRTISRLYGQNRLVQRHRVLVQAADFLAWFEE